MVQAGGLEPPAYFLGGSRSILMSYACNNIVSKINDLIIVQSVSVQLHFTQKALYCTLLQNASRIYFPVAKNSLIGR